MRHNPFGRPLRPALIGQAILVALGLLFGLMVFGTPGSESSDLATGSAARIALASPDVLSPDDQRDVLRAIGTDLCQPSESAERNERRELQGALKDSLDAQSIERFWSRAVAGKRPAELDGAFFRCVPLTTWMRGRAEAEGVNVATIIAARAAIPRPPSS